MIVAVTSNISKRHATTQLAAIEHGEHGLQKVGEASRRIFHRLGIASLCPSHTAKSWCIQAKACVVCVRPFQGFSDGHDFFAEEASSKAHGVDQRFSSGALVVDFDGLGLDCDPCQGP